MSPRPGNNLAEVHVAPADTGTGRCRYLSSAPRIEAAGASSVDCTAAVRHVYRRSNAWACRQLGGNYVIEPVECEELLITHIDMKLVLVFRLIEHTYGSHS